MVYIFIENLGVINEGFLPKQKVTTYKIVDDAVNSTSIKMNLLVKEGNPKLYAYICMNKFDCHITSKDFNNISII